MHLTGTVFGGHVGKGRDAEYPAKPGIAWLRGKVHMTPRCPA